MSRTTLSLVLLLGLTTGSSLIGAAPKPTTREQMFYARREVQLETELSKIKMKYTDSHPRVVQLQQEIDFCKRKTTLVALSRARRGKQPRIATLEQELVTRQDELDHLKMRFTDVDPRVKAAQQEVDNLEREIAMRKKR